MICRRCSHERTRDSRRRRVYEKNFADFLHIVAYRTRTITQVETVHDVHEMSDTRVKFHRHSGEKERAYTAA